MGFVLLAFGVLKVRSWPNKSNAVAMHSFALQALRNRLQSIPVTILQVGLRLAHKLLKYSVKGKLNIIVMHEVVKTLLSFYSFSVDIIALVE